MRHIAAFIIIFLFQLSTVFAQGASKSPVLKWDKVPEAVKYKVEISRSSDFSTKDVSAEVKGLKYKWDSYVPGLSYWRVIAIDAKGGEGKPSEVAEIKVYLSKPKTKADNIKADGPSAKLEWKGSKQAKKYEIQISSSPQFDKAQTLVTTDKSYMLSKVGNQNVYYWHVRTIDENGRPLSEYSDTFMVEFAAAVKAEEKKKEEPKEEEKAFDPIYKYEALAKLSYLITTRSLLVADVRLGAWLQNKPNDQVKWYSKDRFGIQAQYSKSLVNGANSTGTTIDYSRVGAEIRYKIKPQIWAQKTVYGAALSFQNLNIFSTNSSQLGLGAFIGTNEILFIDNLLNKVSFLKLFPRWYEADLNYYILPLTAGSRLSFNLNLNAAIKVFIRPQKFVYAGTSFSSSSFTATNTVQTTVLQTLLGFGIVF